MNSSYENKLDQICATLRKEALEPAEREALEIVQQAHDQAENILQKAKEEACEIVEKAEKNAKEKEALLKEALQVASNKSLDFLRKTIEESFFKENLIELLNHATSDAKIIVQLIQAIAVALEKEGIETDLTVFVSELISVREVNKFLGKTFLSKLKEKTVLEGSFSSGIKVRVNNKRCELDLTTEALKDIFLRCLQKDFRNMVFS